MQRHVKKSVLLAVVLALLAACSAWAADVVVTDGLGREVEITLPVNRIVTNYGIATHMLFALGAEDRLVGIDMPSQQDKFFNSLRPEVGTMASAGSPRELNIEQAIALRPDLLLVPGRNRDLIEGLEARGLTGVFGVIAEDLDQLRTTIASLGKALGEEDKAEKFIKYYDETLACIADRTKDLAEEEKPLVYIAGRDGLLSTCGKDMYQHSVIQMAGGRNAGGDDSLGGAAQGWFKVSPEQLINWDPDYILVVRYGVEVTPEQILSDPRFQGVSAVRNGRVLWFPSNLNSWDFPAPQAVLGVQWLARLLHPDKFADMDLQKDVDEFFRTFYGKSFTELGGEM